MRDIKLRLTITESVITDKGEFLIKKFSIIDGGTGEEIRPAKISHELKSLMDSIQIDIDEYHLAKLSKKNLVFNKLINEFDLTLT